MGGLLARRRVSNNDAFLLTIGTIILTSTIILGASWLFEEHPYVFYGLLVAVVLLVGAVAHVFHVRRRNLMRIREQE